MRIQGATQEAQKLLQQRRKPARKIDKCAHKLIRREATEEEQRLLKALAPYMSKNMKEIYGTYCDVQDMKQAVEAANTTGDYDKYLAEVKNSYLRIKGRSKDLIGYISVGWCTPAAESMLRAMFKLQELQHQLEESGMRLCVLRPLDEGTKNVLDTPPSQALCEQRFGVPGELYCVLEYRDITCQWLAVAHLEYEYEDPVTRKVVSGRVSDDVLFNIPVNTPRILPGVPLRAKVAPKSIKGIAESLMWPLGSLLDTSWARGIVIHYRQ